MGKKHSITLDREFGRSRLGNAMSAEHSFVDGVYTVYWKRGTPKNFPAQVGDRFLVTTGGGEFPRVIKMEAPSCPIMRAMWRERLYRKKLFNGTKEEFLQYCKDNLKTYDVARGYDHENYILFRSISDNIIAAFKKAPHATVWWPAVWWKSKDATEKDALELERKLREARGV